MVPIHSQTPPPLPPRRGDKLYCFSRGPVALRRPLTFCCCPTTPSEQSPSRCRWSCPQTRCRASRYRVTHCQATRSRCRSSRCRPSLRPRAGASAAAACLRAGSPARPDAPGWCRCPRRPAPTQSPAPPRPALGSLGCSCWPCGVVVWWCCSGSAALPLPGSRLSLDSACVCPGPGTGSALGRCPQSWDGCKRERQNFRPLSTWQSSEAQSAGV